MRNVVLLALLALAVACSESTSKPQFNFKPAPKEGLAAKIGDVEVTNAEVADGIESEIYEAEQKLFEIRFNKLKGIIIEKMIAGDSRKGNLSADEFLTKYISKDVMISEKEIDAFIKDQSIPAEHINPQIREKIKSYLEMERKKEAVDKWIAEQTKKTNVDIYLAKPRRPSFEINVGDAPAVGNSDAKVTVVEFSDFQCPFCAKGADIIKSLKKKYGNKVRFVFKNFPLPFHNQAEGAAVAGLCANEQSTDLFWKMHDAMFADQTKLDVDSLKATAKKNGVKADQFNKCLDENKYLAKVQADMEEGRKIKVKSTPTFFINGQLINGAQPLEVFTEIIDEELSR